MRLVLILLVALLLVGMLPTWPYSEPWGFGYWPSGLLGVILIVMLIMAAVGTRAAPPA
jgi:hypothetical protein